MPQDRHHSNDGRSERNGGTSLIGVQMKGQRGMSPTSRVQIRHALDATRQDRPVLRNEALRVVRGITVDALWCFEAPKVGLGRRTGLAAIVRVHDTVQQRIGVMERRALKRAKGFAAHVRDTALLMRVEVHLRQGVAEQVEAGEVAKRTEVRRRVGHEMVEVHDEQLVARPRSSPTRKRMVIHADHHV